MAKFKVTDVSEHTDDWENKHGQYRTYLVRFDGDDEQVQINRKKYNGEVKYVPKVGEELEGAIEITDKGKKFKQDYSGGSSGGSSGGPKKVGQSEEYWKEKDARIQRQWAMGRALELLTANNHENKIITVEQVARAADEFEKHIPGDKQVPF